MMDRPGQTPQTPDDPKTEPLIAQLQDRMERVIDRLVVKPLARASQPHFGEMSQVTLPIDMIEQDDSIEISAELPGIAQTDIDISVRGSLLTIKGKKTAGHSVEDTDYHLQERRFGIFKRQIPLGFIPDADAVRAHFSNGILKLHIKKPTQATSTLRKIDITPD